MTLVLTQHHFCVIPRRSVGGSIIWMQKCHILVPLSGRTRYLTDIELSQWILTGTLRAFSTENNVWMLDQDSLGVIAP